jgi:hypothetical protein
MNHVRKEKAVKEYNRKNGPQPIYDKCNPMTKPPKILQH